MNIYTHSITIRGLIVYLVIAILLLFTLFFSFSCFVETHVLSKCYVFISGSVVLTVIVIFSPLKISVDRTFIATNIFLGYLLIRMCFNNPITISILSVISFYLLYLSLKVLQKEEIRYFEIIAFCVCIAQALYGIGQLMDVFPSHTSFKIVGSFDNPAGFAACLAAGFPFGLTLLEKSKVWKIIGFISLGVVSIAIILSGSRAGIIAIAIALTVYIAHRYSIFINGKKIYIIVLFVLLTIGLIFLKKDSTMGRIGIWNNSIEMIKSRPVLGHGGGSFSSNYMLFQADYFKANPDSNYARLADNVFHPFNEYLLLTIEYGVIGLLLLLGVFITVLFSKHKPLAPLLCLLCVAVFSCFSYPLRYPFIQVLLAYSLVVISKYSVGSQRNRSITVRILMIAMVLLVAVMLIRNILFEYKWGKIAKGLNSINTESTLKSYQDLYDQWNGNSFFLYNYGAVLNKEEHYFSSNVVMRKCIHYLNDYYVQMILGDNYFNMDKLDSARHHYELAHDMAPNRFMPLYCLMELYLKAKNHEKALEIAYIINTKEIKVSSHTITKIRTMAEKTIAEIENE